MNRPEQFGGPRYVLQRDGKKQFFGGTGLVRMKADRRVIRCAVVDSLVEDGGVRRQSCNRELVDVTLELSAVQKIAADVIQPQALEFRHLRKSTTELY